MGRWGAAVVALLTTVTFLPALRNEFVGGFDDAKNFLTNPHYRGLGWTQIEWMFTTMHMGQYVPLTWITLGLDYLLWGMNAAGYHLTSLLLHVVTAVLFYSVSRHLIGLATGRPEAWATAAGAAVAALLFAVHPLRVESVVWVTERRDVVSGVFYMLALLAWFRAVEREPRSRPWYWASVALFAGALLSKALTVALPVVLLVLDVYPLRRLGGAQGWWTPGARRVYAEKAPFVALAAVAAVIALVAIVRLGNMAALERLSLSERVGVSAFSLTFYLWKTLVPVGLSPLYELPARLDLAAPRYLQSFAVVGLTSALGVVLRHRAPWLAGAWIVYVVTLLPVVGILQNGPQIAADRYTYLACLPWALLVGGAAALALRRAWARGREAALALAVAAVLLVVALEALSVNQTGAWRDAVTLWRHAVRVDPSNALAYNNLGAALLDAGRPDEAVDAFKKAVAWMPRSLPQTRANISFMLATALQQQGDLSGAETQYRETLAMDRFHALAWNNLGTVLAIRGEFEEALQAFRNSLAITHNPEACDNGRRAAKILGRALGEWEQCKAKRRT